MDQYQDHAKPLHPGSKHQARIFQANAVYRDRTGKRRIACTPKQAQAIGRTAGRNTRVKFVMMALHPTKGWRVA
jgi:hypothetical protein